MTDYHIQDSGYILLREKMVDIEMTLFMANMDLYVNSEHLLHYALPMILKQREILTEYDTTFNI